MKFKLIIDRTNTRYQPWLEQDLKQILEAWIEQDLQHRLWTKIGILKYYTRNPYSGELFETSGWQIWVSQVPPDMMYRWVTEDYDISIDLDKNQIIIDLEHKGQAHDIYVKMLTDLTAKVIGFDLKDMSNNSELCIPVIEEVDDIDFSNLPELDIRKIYC